MFEIHSVGSGPMIKVCAIAAVMWGLDSKADTRSVVATVVAVVEEHLPKRWQIYYHLYFGAAQQTSISIWNG